ncbi:MAG: alkaline phytoceramidase [Methylococcaceae bacterium]|nr:alkaline phytoceramidase [Methylococcaceae bacterium]
MPRPFQIRLLLAITATGLLLPWLFPRIPQDPAYHAFADSGPWWSIPNFSNVVSNLGFVLAGIAGLKTLPDAPGKLQELELHYRIFFAGVLLTGLGSAYYHGSPDNGTLVWDRLPMTVAFVPLFTLVIGEHLDTRLADRLLAPLLAIGAGSVGYWYWSESQGLGDLRPYALVQFLPMLLIPLILLLFPSRFDSTRPLWALIGWYALAKLLESFDRQILDLTGVIGGHPLKHVAAAIGVYQLVLALRQRRIRPTPNDHPGQPVNESA